MAFEHLTAVELLQFSQFPTDDVDIVNVGKTGSPLLSVIAGMGRKTLNGEFSGYGLREKFWTKGTTYTFYEYDDYPTLFQVNGAVASTSTTTVTFDSTAGMVRGSVLINTLTNEQFRVTSITSATVAELTRGFGTVAAANIADNSPFILVATSTAYGSTGQDGVELTPTAQTNYFTKVTRTIKRTDLENFVQNELSDLNWENVDEKKNVWINREYQEHARQIERAILFSQKKWDATNRIGAVEGLYRMAIRGGNTGDISAGPTLALLTANLAPLYLRGDAKVRYGFYGSSCNAVLQALIQTHQQYQGGAYKVGELNLTFNKITLTGGQELYLIQHPMMDSTSGLAGKLLVIDPTQLKLVYSKGQDFLGKPLNGTTQMFPLPNSSYAEQSWDIVTYFSLHNANSQAHGVLTLA